ncbi:unnamed protein product [Tenebrio molitor]|nr:unnamed protein product [Tenebrio molitor]
MKISVVICVFFICSADFLSVVYGRRDFLRPQFSRRQLQTETYSDQQLEEKLMTLINNDQSDPNSPLNHLRNYFIQVSHLFLTLMKLEKGKIEMIPEEFYAMSQSITDQGNYIRQIILPGLHDLLDNVTTLLSDIYDSHHSQ